MSQSVEIFDLAIVRAFEIRGLLACALEELESVDDPAPGPDLVSVAQAVSQALMLIDALLSAGAKRSLRIDETPLERHALLLEAWDALFGLDEQDGSKWRN